MSSPDRDLKGTRAPEFPGEMKWFNSEPLSMQELRGKLVMIDFWTYSCVNCVRTLPYLKKWHEKYSGLGLVIVGVHTPEFEFEKDEENVAMALAKFDIKYPVILDSAYQVWSLYANRWWPRKLLVDGEGYIRYDHIGEGAYEETEKMIQTMLADFGADVKNIPSEKVEGEGSGGVCYPTTAEAYCGYYRGVLGNKEGYKRDLSAAYVDPGNHEDGYVFLAGQWYAAAEFLQYYGKPGEGTLTLKYHALEVNAVLKPQESTGFKLWVKKDGQFLTDKDKGKNVQLDSQGRSYVEISEPKLYNLVWEPKGVFGTHEIQLIPDSDSFSIYAFTFGACT